MIDSTIESLRNEQRRLSVMLDELNRRIEILALKGASTQSESMPVSEAISEPPPLPPIPTPTPTPVRPTPPPPVALEEESFELRFGQVWLVRIGIATFLAGLVFLASFTYQHFIQEVPPFGRAVLLFLASLALTGLGFWLERSRETLRYYGRVVAAGGLAGGYYALYGSHYVEALRWLESPGIEGVLLMGWAALIVSIACWRASQTLGLAAIILAYFTSIISPDATYTLFSNLVLAGASVYLTIRYGWKFISYAALAATYGVYAFFSSHHLSSEAAQETWTVACYWVVFTLPVLWPRVNFLETAERVLLLTMNNACFLLVGAFCLPWSFEERFWSFSICFGIILVATSFLSRKLNPTHEEQEGAFFIQGLIVATLGWLSKWHGADTALLLGVESMLLLYASFWRHRRVLRSFAWVVATLAFFIAAFQCMVGMTGQPNSNPILLVGIFVAEALWVAWYRQETDAFGLSEGYLGSLATLLYLIWIHKWVPEENQFWVLVLSGAGVYGLQLLKRPTSFLTTLACIFWFLDIVVFGFVYDNSERIFWANGLALVGLFALERVANKRFSEENSYLQVKTLGLSLLFIAWCTYFDLLMNQLQPGWSTTLLWSLLAGALFGLGLVCRERVARWWGLIILGAALGRILLVDIWQLDTLSRIFTFLGLGAVLLVLGFVYNRYQESIKRWL